MKLSGGSIGQALALDDEGLWNFRNTLLTALSGKSVDSFAFGAELTTHRILFARLL